MSGDQQANQQINQIAQAAQQGDQQAAALFQVIQNVAKKMKGVKAQKGAKLNYIKSLKAQCTEDEELVYLKAGGKVCPVCQKKQKVQSAKCGGAVKSANGLGNWGTIAGDALSGIGSMIGNKYGEDFTDQQKATQSAIRKGLAMIPGYGQLIAAATGALDAIGTTTGMNLSNLDQNSANRAGVGGSAKFNNVMNSIPGASMLLGGLWAGDRTNSFNMSDESEAMSSGYAGTVGDMRAAEDLGNKRMLFQKRKANSFIDTAKNNDQILAEIGETNTMRKQSNYYQDLAHQNINRYAGQNYLGTRVGRTGLKLMSIDEVRAIIAKRQETQKFQNGGVVGIDSNILPEGALHARKNNLAELNSDLEDATKKGIPVMAAEGGEVGEQVAEIENSEIIFRLDVTRQLEELRKDGSEEAMIEAGKLVADELIENTQDNTGQITEEEVENGK